MGNHTDLIGRDGSRAVEILSLFLGSSLTAAMLRKYLQRALLRAQRPFHSSSIARRVVATNPAKAEEVKVVHSRSMFVLFSNFRFIYSPGLQESTP
jgi:hypothetical protein